MEARVKSSSPITTWKDLRNKYDEYVTKAKSSPEPSRWIFRGQQNASWHLKPSLERAMEHFEKPLSKMRRYESRLVREFKRHLHRHSEYVPEDDEMLEWLTLMQHHGAPTRLLDWTYSFYIALFFAIEGACKDQTCAIWAVNQKRCWDMVVEQLPVDLRKLSRNGFKDPKAQCRLLQEFRKPLISPLNPFRLNTRLAVQQGTFLVPLDLTRSFQDIFDASIAEDSDCSEKIKIVCSKKLITRVLTELQKMNITALSLFPGIDGFARSLRHIIPLKYFWTYV
jgi:FRG domain